MFKVFVFNLQSVVLIFKLSIRIRFRRLSTKRRRSSVVAVGLGLLGRGDTDGLASDPAGGAVADTANGGGDPSQEQQQQQQPPPRKRGSLGGGVVPGRRRSVVDTVGGWVGGSALVRVRHNRVCWFCCCLLNQLNCC